MASTTLQKITTRAKQIRKGHPNMEWKTAVKKAGAEYRGGKISGTGARKKARGSSARKKSPGRRIGAVPSGSTGSSDTAAGLESMLKKKLNEQLGWLLVQQRTAPTKTARKKLAPKIRELTSKIKALKK
jgi:hypothetical protein